MSSDFALLLNMPTTRLLVRDDDAWKVVGDATLDGDNPGTALAALREKGEEIAGGAFPCMLILPNDQIKYLSVPAGADDEATARAALNGATPYAVEDLAYDWKRVGERLYVAAVAHETLDEARDFVAHHGFSPAGNIAHPKAADFPARPVFDSKDVARGEDVLPLGGAYVPKPPSPPPAFSSRRETPPAPVSTSVKATASSPRLNLSAPQPSAAPVNATLSSGAKPLPEATDKHPVATARSTSPPPMPSGLADAPAAQIGGKPRHLGLMLTLLLLAILAAIALWSFTLGEDEVAIEPETEREIAAVEKSPAVQGGAAVDQSASDEPRVPQSVSDPEIAEEVTEALPDIDAPNEVLFQDLPAKPVPPKPLTDDEVASRYESTGIWQRAPRDTAIPQEPSLDQFYVPSIDPEVKPSDAIALPDVADLTDDAPAETLAEPTAPDQTFALDQNGRVIPTAEGTLSPDGILIFAGRPPVTVAPRAVEAEPQAPEPDQRLAALRPELRPDGLQEANERAQLGGRTLEEFASIRPKLRPKAPQELAAEIAAAAAAAAEALENPPETTQPQAAPDPFATGTRLASAKSRKPQTRPRNFARIVETARPRTEEPSGSGRVVASVAPRSVRPSGPVPTTVSRAATMENAINLRRVNLIGVFGKPSSRRALVRLKSGRIVKVSVGDRIDGGRVAAIGESELRYVKSGRNLTLKIPSS